MRILHSPCEPCEKGGSRRIRELVAEPLREDQTEHARAAEPQASRGRIRTCVSEAFRGGEHTLADLLGD
jgi:hypothetical protein